MAAMILMMFVSFVLAGLGVVLFAWVAGHAPVTRAAALLPLDEDAMPPSGSKDAPKKPEA